MTMGTGEVVVWLSKVIRLGAVWNTAKNVVTLDPLTCLIGVLEVPGSTYKQEANCSYRYFCAFPKANFGKWILSFKFYFFLYVPPGLTFKNSNFRPHSALGAMFEYQDKQHFTPYGTV